MPERRVRSVQCEGEENIRQICFTFSLDGPAVPRRNALGGRFLAKSPIGGEGAKGNSRNVAIGSFKSYGRTARSMAQGQDAPKKQQ